MRTPRRAPANRRLLDGSRPVVVVLRRAISVTVGLAAAALLLLHVFIFWKHLVSGALADPAKGFAWTVGFAILGLMVALRRAGVPLLWGRRAAAVWIMVALLHVGVLKPASAAATTTTAAVEAALSLLTVPPSLVSLALFAGMLLALAVLRRRRHMDPLLAAVLVRHNRAMRPARPSLRSLLTSRAPPITAR